MRMRRQRLASRELGYRTPVDVDQRAGRIGVVSKQLESGSGIANRSDEPKGVADFPATSERSLLTRPTDGC